MNESNAEALEIWKVRLLKMYQALPTQVQKQHPEIPQKIQELKDLSQVAKPLQPVKQYLTSPTIRKLM